MVGGTSMLGQEAGWYQDPAPPNPDLPDRLRYWDGHAWTAEVKIASKKQRLEWAEQAAATRQVEVRRIREAAAAGDPEAQQILIAATSVQSSPWTTPDGALLAGWWRRAGALVIDNLLLNILGAIFAWRYIERLFHAFYDYSLAASNAAQQGKPAPDPSALLSSVQGPAVAIAVIYVVTGFFYEVGFLKAFQATPGKMALGMEVRLREAPGPLSWGTVIMRWFGKKGISVLGVIPLAVLFTWIYEVLDYLWPVWDAKKQAIHDKMARTNVVRR